MKAGQGISKTLNRFTRKARIVEGSCLRYLFRDITNSTSVLVAFLIATAHVLYLFPVTFLMGQSGLFDQLEPLTSISGWWSFKVDSWHFPLLHTRLLNSPEGINIAATNSIPLVALLLKPFRHFLPSGFHYFGIWFLITHGLQAIGANLAIRSVGQKTLLATLSGSMMGLMMPILLWQTTNIPLTTQAYLLYGLALYNDGLKNTPAFNSTTYRFTLLLSASLLTHPYLFAMMAVFYIAFLGDFYRKSSKHQTVILHAFVMTIFCLLLVAIVVGYIGHPVRVKGYGQYAMNLLAPFSGGQLGHTLIHATPGQQRGFNYLGMGTLASLVLTLIIHRELLIPTIQRCRTLATLLLGLVLFSLSNQLFYDKHLLFRYPVFFPFNLITGTFPSSGRFFWPCAYTLVIVGLLGVLKIRDKLLSTVSTLAILSIQFYDTIPLRRALYRTVRQPVATTDNWHHLVRAVSTVQVYPAYQCGTHSAPNIVFWQNLAARHGRPINTVYFARGKSHCPTKHSAFNKPMRKNQLYVVTQNQDIPHHISFAMDQGWCRSTDKGIVCVRDTDYRWWKNYFSKAGRTPKKHSPKIKAARKKKAYVDWPDHLD